MARIPLLGGAYSLPGLIAAEQRSVNVYAEINPREAQSPAQVSHYPRAGLTPLSAPPSPGRGRGLYTDTSGELFAVVDQAVYHIHYEDGWAWHLLGQLLTPGITPVLGADNGQNALLVDGSSNGYIISMPQQVLSVLTQIGDPNFYGGTLIDFIDGFLVLNKPDTNLWYCSNPFAVTFNALYFGQKAAWPDNVLAVRTVERLVWVFGPYKSEIWFNAGTVPFPFSADPSSIIEHGCCAAYSIAKQDTNIYWLSQSPEGARMLMKGGAARTAKRISTHAVEAEWRTYPRVDDAIGSTYQIRGHAFYQIDFPTADRTWVFDEATQQFHEKAWYDVNGIQHRARDTFHAFAYGTNVAQDWNTGQIYALDERNFTDNGTSIVCVRTMPHLLESEHYDRMSIAKFIADMECGTGSGTVNKQTVGSPWSLGFSPGFGPQTYIGPPLISLRWSRDRGNSWGNPVTQPMGAAGLYLTTPTWNRCGYGRDFIFELSWATPMSTVLNGAWVEPEEHGADQ